ncbi:unnamed protein product [Orchesella dallaii]|uniref:Metalloendopeptidase n=1 Tax=Orchesella dallaii TaxID=48710 RepID=A0ABP1RV29_9HEXA
MLWKHLKIFSIFFVLSNLSKIPTSNGLAYRTNRAKWPNGVVPHKLHTSLTLDDIAEVKKGFNEYHTKTCIKFVPWKEGDLDFISIEVDNSQCILSSSCKVGGYQFVRIGGNCRNMGYVIFGLGHALCFTNENLRSDRDNYLEFKANCTTIPELDATAKGVGMYDYSSIFHNSGCKTCRTGWPRNVTLKSCGRSNDSQSLSALDVDGINAVYNCQGCRRHRWQPFKLLTHEQKTNMHSFGETLLDGKHIYPCRVLLKGSVIHMGQYDVQNNTCQVPSFLMRHEPTIGDNVEVLTIPGGLEAQCSVYKLASPENALKKGLVVGGSSLNNRRLKGFVVFTFPNTTEYMTDSHIRAKWLLENSGNTDLDYVDKRLSDDVGSGTVVSGNYKVLTCSLDTFCMLEQLYFENMKDKK